MFSHFKTASEKVSEILSSNYKKDREFQGAQKNITSAWGQQFCLMQIAMTTGTEQ